MSYSLYLRMTWIPGSGSTRPPVGRRTGSSAVDLLQRDTELQEIVQLVGPDALQEQERLVLEMARMIKESFLQQNAFSDDDAYSSFEKTGHLLEALMAFYGECQLALTQGVSLEALLEHPIREEVARSARS